MKKFIILLYALLISISSSAQGLGINYKAVLKDTNGNVLSDTFMNVQFTIHEATATGTIVYQEDHNYTTDSNGLLIHNIGSEPSPSIGVFADIDWGAYQHFLQVSITYSGGTVNFDATEFMAVPYAKHASTAGNVFSGDYNDLINQPTIISSGLETIDEGDGIGWRLKDFDPNNYGAIGEKAVDLSYSEFGSPVNGATGNFSTAIGYGTKATGQSAVAMGEQTSATGSYSTSMGFSSTASGNGATAMGLNTTASGIISIATGQHTIASGYNSMAMGVGTTASGDRSIAIGNNITSPSYAETTVGIYNLNYTPSTTNGPGAENWNPTDRLFIIGNGAADDNRNNALTVLKNGTITAPSFDISEITDNKALVTKEYADTNYASDGNYLITGGNVVSNNVGIGRATASSLFEVAHANSPPTTSDYTNALSIHNVSTGGSWQLSTVNAGHLNLYKNGSYRGYFNQASGAYTQASDRRVKKDITPIDNGTLYKVLQLNPVSYLMKEQTDSKRNIGLISQEVQEIFPSITNYVEEHDLIALSYTELIPILIKALQEQQDIIDGQNTQIKTLSKDNSSLEKTVNNIIDRVEKIEAVNQ